MIDPSQIVGYGVDADPSRRPGYPKEREPRPVESAKIPAQQSSDVTVFKNERPYKEIPPVYGTAQPPKGLSGRVRKLAYSYPDHWTRHWMLLLLADRVDVWEHRLSGARGVAALGAVALFGVLATRMIARG
ncbi:hypothetical protein [Sandaracinus amylolyticus]|nr:hypothetical protein [Sandaracinus amylolyticus]